MFLLLLLFFDICAVQKFNFHSRYINQIQNQNITECTNLWTGKICRRDSWNIFFPEGLTLLSFFQREVQQGEGLLWIVAYTVFQRYTALNLTDWAFNINTGSYPAVAYWTAYWRTAVFPFLMSVLQSFTPGCVTVRNVNDANETFFKKCSFVYCEKIFPFYAEQTIETLSRCASLQMKSIVNMFF